MAEISRALSLCSSHFPVNLIHDLTQCQWSMSCFTGWRRDALDCIGQNWAEESHVEDRREQQGSVVLPWPLHAATLC